MNRTLLPDDMKQLEAEFMREYAVPSALLMEHASASVVEALRRYVRREAVVLFICGPGANGGDGYAAARMWQLQGGHAMVIETDDHPKGDALMNRTLCALSGVVLMTASEKMPFHPCEAAVDALFGTGLNRPVSGLPLMLIQQMNALSVPVISVDIPSGLHGGTGEILGEAVHATETVTFHRIKTGLLLRHGPDCTGKLTVHPILIPQNFGHAGGLRFLEPDALKQLPSRPATGHKGTFGRVVIFAGSEGMAGAAALCASACVKSGAGLTRLLCRPALLPILQTLVPEATCTVLPEADGHLLPDASAQTAAEALSDADCAILGCGLSRRTDALPVLNAFRQAVCPVIWDADALNLLSDHPEMLPLPEKDMITPHPGEAARLLHIANGAVTADPLAALHALNEQIGSAVLLKGARSMMTDGKDEAVNLCGSPAMGKGGSGDVLAGILAAVVAQFRPIDPLTAMQTASLIHGAAGMRAAESLGEACVTPTDLVCAIRIS